MTNEDFIQSIALPGEEWRDVVGYEGRYVVSSLGRVCSLLGKAPRVLQQYAAENRGRKYAYVCLRALNNSKKLRVHRLVAESFLPQPDGKCEVDHINNDPLDNRVANLRWCSHKENMQNPLTKESERLYKIKHPCTIDPKVFFNKHEGERVPIVLLKDGIVVNSFSSLREAEDAGYKKTSVSAALHKRLRTYRGFIWMRKSEYESQVSMSKNS